MSPAKVVMFVGSLRKESFNRKMAAALSALNVAPLQFEFAEIGRLPLYNQDLEGEEAPAEWVALRQQVKKADAVLFITPEYNRSVPGVLKNAIDVASRPYGQNTLEGKPGAVIGVSPGAMGAFGAVHHLRQMMVFLNVPMMQQPEAYMGGATQMFDAKGGFAQENTREFMKKFVEAFAKWIERIRG
ncbi:MAG TPA: NAD(P)H-dependent oxidoreductase [Candidatus Sulfotelmatobacter sp.]|nr:NAD(P)H-dependent oxidoreductase [Candidatus Sulfotelmatobacter sp.]